MSESRELIFDVTIDEDGRYVAEARGNGIATDGADWDELRVNVQELIAAYAMQNSFVSYNCQARG